LVFNAPIVGFVCCSGASFSAVKSPKNVWRPGSARTRWGSLSAPPDPLAVSVGKEGDTGWEGKTCLIVKTLF
jgi:hypothetical protein